jgi:hypothetical protein
MAEIDLNPVPELAAAFAVTTIDNSEGSVGGIYRTAGALSAAKGRVATNGFPTVFPLPGNKILLSEIDPNEPKPLKLITQESAAKWTAEDNAVPDLSELRSLAVVGENTLGIDGARHEVVKFDTSASPWKIAKTCVYAPVAAGATAFGQLLGICGKHVVAVFNEIKDPGTHGASWSPAQLVVLNPDDLTPLSGTLNGFDAKSIPLGQNVTAIDILTIKGSPDTYEIYVAAAGGRQGTPKGNGQNSRLDVVCLSIDDKGAFKAASKTLLTGEDEGSNDVQSVAVSPSGALFLLLAKVQGFDEETHKSRVTWELFSTSTGLLKNLDKAPTSILGVPVQRNIYEFEEGFLWDLIYNSEKDELWMGHGNDIYIYRLHDRDPWGDPDAFSQEDMNKDPFGNLHSFCVTVECQNGAKLVKDMAKTVKTPAVRVSSIREAIKHLHHKKA